MKKRFNNIGSKIFTGYIVLIIIAIFSLSHIYSTVENIVAEDDINSVPRQKIHLLANTQVLLYESEAMSLLMDTPNGNHTHYNETLDKAKENLQELSALTEDSLFRLKTDTLRMLIERRRTNTRLLTDIWKQAGDSLYDKNIRKVLETNWDDIEEAILNEQISKQQDTTVTSGTTRKTFFRRLAEVFVPTEARDSTVQITSNQQIDRDTILRAYNPAEIITNTLLDIQRRVAAERRRLHTLQVARSTAIQYDNILITEKIYQILRDMEKDETEASLGRIQRRQDLLDDTSYLITSIVAVSLAVALFFILFIGWDLFKSRYYRKQLEKEKQCTEDLLNSREKLILTIGHDIRAPLSSIMGYIELLRRSFPDDKQRMFLSNMSSSSSHILTLINDLMDFQRLDSNQMEIHEIPFRVETLFHEIYVSFKPQAESKGLELDYVVKGCSGLVYQGDSIRIRQITGNLLSNALKFTNEGKVEIEVECHRPATDNINKEGAEATVPQALLTVTVKDSGSGIPAEQQERIFNEFTRLEGVEKTEGFGLGLSIAHKLVALLNGSISLKSEVGKGSDFTVTLPLSLSENQQLPEKEKEEEEDIDVQVFKNRPVTCLIVDDDLLQIVLMEEVLKQLHLNVVSCTNPRLVLPMLKEKQIDVLITDIQMPGMDGYDLVKLVRASDLPDAQELPVIALSATVGQGPAQYLKAGFTDAIGKPFTAKQLVSLLNRIFPEGTEMKKAPDFSKFTAFVGEDKQAFANILRTFSEETSKHIELLKGSLANKDRVLSAQITHKLGPLFTMIEAKTLVQQLYILERNDMELTDSGWKSLLEDVIRQIESILVFANQKTG